MIKEKTKMNNTEERTGNEDLDSWKAPGVLKTDITLVVEKKKIKCHKEILSENSEYFSAMFNSNMKESVLDEIELKDVDFESFKKLMILIYDSGTNTESTNINTVQDNIDLLVVASIFQFKEILNDISKAIETSLDVQNCLEIMIVADMHGLSKLKKKAAKICFFYFHAVVKTEYFLHIDKDYLLRILKTESPNISEDELLQAIEKWILFDHDTRQKVVYELLECLRLGCISSKALQDLQTKKYFTSSDSHEGKSEKLVNAILSAKTHPKEQTDLQIFFTHRKKRECLFSVGGYKPLPARSEGNEDVWEKDSPKPVPLIQKIDIETGKLREISEITQFPENGCAICCQGRNVLFIGGEFSFGRGSWMYGIRKFDSLTETWSTVASLQSPVRHHSAVTLGEYLYVIGGVGKFRIMLDTVKRVHLETGEWETMPSLSRAMYCAPACVLNDTIYIIKNGIEYFNPDTDSCWKVAPIPFEPFKDGVHTCFKGYGGKKIVCILGIFNTKLVEVNTEIWSCYEIELCDKKCIGATSIGNHLFISTADDSTVHCYDMMNDYKLLYEKKIVDTPFGSPIFTLPDFDLYKFD